MCDFCFGARAGGGGGGGVGGGGGGRSGVRLRDLRAYEATAQEALETGRFQPPILRAEPPNKSAVRVRVP